VGATVIAHGDPAPVCDAPEHMFDFVPLFVERVIVCERYLAVFSWRDARRHSPFDQRHPEPVRSVAAIRKQLFCFWQIIQNTCCACIIAHLSFGQEKNDRLSLAVAPRVQLRVQAAFRATDAAGNIPFLSRLAAVLCAFRCVASIITRSGVPDVSASSLKMQLNTPILLQRTTRLYTVVCGPYSRGASCPRRPFLIT